MIRHMVSLRLHAADLLCEHGTSKEASVPFVNMESNGPGVPFEMTIHCHHGISVHGINLCFPQLDSLFTSSPTTLSQTSNQLPHTITNFHHLHTPYSPRHVD